MKKTIVPMLVCLVAVASAQWVETTIPLDTSGGVGALAISYGAGANKVYVSMFRDVPPPIEPVAVAVVDGGSNALLKTLRLGIDPIVASAGDKMCGSFGDSLAVIDGILDSVTAFVPVGLWGLGYDYSPVFNKVYIASPYVDSVVVVDAVADTLLGVVPLSLPADGLCHDTVGSKIYCVTRSAVIVLDASVDTILTQIPVGTCELSGLVCLNVSRNKLYCEGSTGLVVIDCERDTVVGHVPLADATWEMCYNPLDDKLYLAGPDSAAVTVVDCARDSVVALVPTRYEQDDLCYNSINNKLYCASWRGGNVTVIDCGTDSVVSTLPVGLHAGPMVYNPYENRIYVIASYFALAVIRDVMPGVQEVSVTDERCPILCPSIVRGALLLRVVRASAHCSLLTADGRRVADLVSGPNDVRHLSPGVYFVREAQAQAQLVRKVVLTK